MYSVCFRVDLKRLASKIIKDVFKKGFFKPQTIIELYEKLENKVNNY